MTALILCAIWAGGVACYLGREISRFAAGEDTGGSAGAHLFVAAIWPVLVTISIIWAIVVLVREEVRIRRLRKAFGR